MKEGKKLTTSLNNYSKRSAQDSRSFVINEEDSVLDDESFDLQDKLE